MTKEQLLNKANFLIFPTNLPSNRCKVTVDTDMFAEIRKRFPSNNIVSLPIGDLYSYWYLNSHHYIMDYHKGVVLPTISKIFNLGIENDNVFWKKITDGIPKNYFIETPVWDNDKYLFVNHSLKCNSIRNSLIANNNDKIEKNCVTPYHKLFVGSHSICTVVNIKEGCENKKLFMVCNSQMIPSIPVLAHYYRKMVIVDRRVLDFNISTLYENETFDDVLICAWRFFKESAEKCINNVLTF